MREKWFTDNDRPMTKIFFESFDEKYGHPRASNVKEDRRTKTIEDSVWSDIKMKPSSTLTPWYDYYKCTTTVKTSTEHDLTSLINEFKSDSEIAERKKCGTVMSLYSLSYSNDNEYTEHFQQSLGNENTLTLSTLDFMNDLQSQREYSGKQQNI